MKCVHISASKGYDVLIGRGLLPSLGERAAALCRGRTCCIVSDDTVAALYEPAARGSLEQAGFTVCTYIFPHGEESKSGENFLKLMSFLAANHLTRTDLLVALGGGVTGDLTGFAAACYLRGVQCIQVPTSLLAMVDSSVGGKTAIDLPEGKNLCGAFYQPALVLCDIDTLDTLPRDIFLDGCAEVIKYGVLGSRELFDKLHGDYDLLQVVAQCVDMKRAVVEDDEFDTGRRQLLNLGHTLGHAIEALSNFTLSHGKCVAIGMAMMARAAVKKGFCPRETADEIISLISQFGLPTDTDTPAQEIYQTALGDKKRQGGSLTLVVPVQIGDCLLHKIPVEDLLGWIV
ncbi:MAG: 3-dehydroquinate synthase [Oscillospiraceae bacterium]|nr:3-dehydroquinate synthase [Oscillospiraceae bacterium]